MKNKRMKRMRENGVRRLLWKEEEKGGVKSTVSTSLLVDMRLMREVFITRRFE